MICVTIALSYNRGCAIAQHFGYADHSWSLSTSIHVRKNKGTKTKTALKQETYNLSDLNHDPHCGFVELGGSVSVS
jgi:hypothetical protein